MNKIRQFTESKERAMEIIQYSIDHAYLTFYDFDKNYGKKSNTKQAWNENVKSVSYTEDERKEQEEFRQQLEKEGKQVIF